MSIIGGAGSADEYVRQIAPEHVPQRVAAGRPSDTNVLDAIAALLDGAEWHGGTIDEVADLVRESGRTIDEPGAEGEQ